jgi:hypothetical protein
MAEPNRDKIRQYFEIAWKQVSEELSIKLVEFGFAPKNCNGKFEIGNKHGQVYAYTAENSQIHDSLFLLMINPTHTGKLSIKLTFQDIKKCTNVTEKIRTFISAKSFGKLESTKEGRFAVEYFFYTEPLSADPNEASAILYETAITWLKAITSVEG